VPDGACGPGRRQHEQAAARQHPVGNPGAAVPEHSASERAQADSGPVCQMASGRISGQEHPGEERNEIT